MYTVPVGQNPTGAVSSLAPSACVGMLKRFADDGSQQEERDLRHLRRVWCVFSLWMPHLHDPSTDCLVDVIIVEDDPYYFLQEGPYYPSSYRAREYDKKDDSLQEYIDALTPSYLRYV